MTFYCSDTVTTMVSMPAERWGIGLDLLQNVVLQLSAEVRRKEL